MDKNKENIKSLYFIVNRVKKVSFCKEWIYIYFNRGSFLEMYYS